MEFINYTLYNKAEDIKRLKFIIDNLPVRDKKQLNILEIGCGEGNICYQMARYGHKVTGIDISDATIKSATQKFGDTPGLTFRVEDAEQLKMAANDKYDVIVCSEILEHLYEPAKLVANFENLLHPEGIAIVTVPNGFGPREVLITKPVQRLKHGDGSFSKFVKKFKASLGYRGDTDQSSADELSHIQFFSMKQLTRLAETSGFQIIKKKSGNFVENVFPFSMLSRRLFFIQKLDCMVADVLPLNFTSQYYSVWKRTDQR
ncbi:MAG: methyltransferase domain-containing protein [Bacteroidetes bacterium]|nr:methyltransferase domain-containing protein [Bacteroidota bacterium]